MLTEVRADGAWDPAEVLAMHLDEAIETDTIQIRNIAGLEPVNASITTEPYGDVDGVYQSGTKVDTRNIVLTLGLNSDWDVWTISRLRTEVFKYFIPKQTSRLVFFSDDMATVEISGAVESVTTNIFSKDPEVQVSIVCPDPHFQALELSTHTGTTLFDIEDPFTYNGTVETGVNIKVYQGPSGDSPGVILVRNNLLSDPFFSDPYSALMTIASIDDPLLDADHYFELNSVPLQKYVKTVELSGGEIDRLDKVIQGPLPWPRLRPGRNLLSFYADYGGPHPYVMTYYERYGGL